MAGDWKCALCVRTRIQGAGITLSIHVYNALIATCERYGGRDCTLQLHRYMESEGVETNNVTVRLFEFR